MEKPDAIKKVPTQKRTYGDNLDITQRLSTEQNFWLTTRIHRTNSFAKSDDESIFFTKTSMSNI